MDSTNKLPLGGSEVLEQNGVHGESPGKNGFDLDADAASNGSFENDGFDTSVEETEKVLNANCQSNSVAPMVEEVKNMDHEQSKPSKVISKSSNEKPLGPKNVSASLVKKKKEGNVEGPFSLSNGPVASRPKQPIKSKSFTDKKIQVPKSSHKSDTASSKIENSKLKPSRKGADDIVEGRTETDMLNAEDGTPHRMGRLPNYSFSFRCDERADKRREFYSKLEEKINAKEIEKSNLQAKTQETQEAELKMLRKSLAFKATPMPSFYQEPPPPKVELKKIPTTRAKSPKLGRRKSFTSTESEKNSSGNVRLNRLSLDVKISQNNSTEGVSPVHIKKPQRKSFPHLPSQRTVVTRSKVNGKNHTAEVMNENTDISNSTHEEKNTSFIQVTEGSADFTEPNEDNISPSSINQYVSTIEMLPAALGIASERESYQNGD